MKHIAAVIEMEWPFKRHYDVFAGIEGYRREHAPDWVVDLDPFPDAVMHGDVRGPNYAAVVGRLTPAVCDAARAKGIPAVNVWTKEARNVGVPSVLPDCHAAGRMAIDHFTARGIRNVATIGMNDRFSRLVAESFVEAAGCREMPVQVHNCSFTLERDAEQWTDFCRTVETWLAEWNRPIGVLVTYSQVAHYLTLLAQREGWRIPEQLAVLAINNEELICESSTPSLSAIEMNFYRSGYEAARLTHALMNGEAPPDDTIWIEPAKLVLRQSTDFYAVDDQKIADVLRYMADHYDTDVMVVDIARHVGLGRRTLERRFRAALGRSIVEELNRLRVERLKRLLVETDYAVKYLVRETGFGTAEQMRQVFHKHTGVTATEYRKAHR
jgi:LacI family transcriptional regulator